MNKIQKIVMTVLAIAFLGACGTAYYFYHATQSASPAAQAAAQAQTNATIAKVGQLIVLPTGETPTIATVINPDLLKGQLFFANAQKGDVVLIYTNAKEAILYDPNMNKIVEVAPINIGTPTTPVESLPSATSSATSTSSTNTSK